MSRGKTQQLLNLELWPIDLHSLTVDSSYFRAQTINSGRLRVFGCESRFLVKKPFMTQAQFGIHETLVNSKVSGFQKGDFIHKGPVEFIWKSCQCSTLGLLFHAYWSLSLLI